MRRINLLLIGLLSIITACATSTDPGDDPAVPGDITVEGVTGLPSVGGNVSAIASDGNGGVIALIDGGLYTFASPSAPAQRMGTGNNYKTFGRAPNGDVYAITGTDIQFFDQGADPPRSTPIDPAGPIAVNRRVEKASVAFSASGEAFITMINNYPQMYAYRSSNDGATWNEISLPSAQFMTALALAPNGNLYGASATAFYVSTSQGVTWQAKPPAMVNYSGTMTVASDGAIYYWLPQTGALRVSRDEGTTFTQLSEFNRPPFYIDIKEGSGGVLYALASKVAQLTTQQSWLARSTDRGATWATMLYANGRALAVAGSNIAVGLGGDDQQLGGMYWSSDAGSTWSASGMRSALQINDVAFDRNGALLALIDNALFRRTSGGWQLLASQGRGFDRIAANLNGAIAIATTSSVYYSNDNGFTWSENAITDYIPGSRGGPAVPAFIARSNGEFLMSLTTYDNGGNGYHAGVLYRIASDGIPKQITGIGTTFRSLVEDRNGKLYGGEESLDPISQTFRAVMYTSQGDASTWTAAPSGTKSGSSYNSRNRYVRTSSNTELAMGTSGGGEDAAQTLRGFPTTNNMIGRMMFDRNDRLYITSITGGLYMTTTALK